MSLGISQSIILGAIEGISEFLPISSTGHMILGARLMGLVQDEILKCFEVVIQLGAILAIIFIFFDRLRGNFRLWLKLGIGFFPTAIIGFLLYKYIKSLFKPEVVAYMLIIGGLCFIIVELWHKKNKLKPSISELKDISHAQAFIIGLSQCLAMVPGVSRSGATIVTGLLCGLSRELCARFSFLLAIPTMFGASFYDLYKNRTILSQNLDQIWIFLLGGVLAFVLAFLSVKIFLKFISNFSYIGFGVYRIIIGAVFLFYV